jgi:hypothetical protein
MRTTLFTLGMLAAPRVLLACPVCFGQNDTPMGNAIKGGVILMLVLVAGVLAGFGAFIVHLNRRARLVDAAERGAGQWGPRVAWSGIPGEGPRSNNDHKGTV